MREVCQPRVEGAHRPCKEGYVPCQKIDFEREKHADHRLYRFGDLIIKTDRYDRQDRNRVLCLGWACGIQMNYMARNRRGALGAANVGHLEAVGCGGRENGVLRLGGICVRSDAWDREARTIQPGVAYAVRGGGLPSRLLGRAFLQEAAFRAFAAHMAWNSTSRCTNHSRGQLWIS